MSDRRVVFIVGNSRSGTTMLGRILGNHPDVHTFGELHFFESMVDAETVRSRPAWPESRRVAMVERLIGRAREGVFARAAPGRYRDDAQRICIVTKADDPISAYESFIHAETARQGKSIPCEQTPRYLYFAEEILEAFPNARIINIVRDPRDVLLSQKFRWRRRELGGDSIPRAESFRSRVNYHPYTITRLWVSAVSIADRLMDRPRFKSVRFEDLIVDPSGVIGELCSFVGIQFASSMLDIPQLGSSTGQDRPETRGIDATRTGGWRLGGLSTVELAICQRAAAGEMRKWAYRAEPLHVAPWKIWLRMAVLPIQMTLALILNVRRTTNVWQSLRRRMHPRRDAS
jgi:hypothetical protein